MKRFLLGTIIAAVAGFIWGAVFWMSPLPNNAIGQAKSDTLLGAELKLTLNETGVYYLPSGDPTGEEFQKLHRAGPIAMIFYQRKGAEPMAGSTFAAGLVHGWASIALTAILLGMALPALASYGKRVGFVALVGIVSTVFSSIGGTVWWPIPLDWALIMSTYEIIFWVIAGLILAAFYKPETA